MRAMNSAGFLALACVLLAGGCAGSTSEERCAHTDWYQQGYMDGRRTWYSRIDEHTARCAASGVKPDAAQYQKGWADGRFDYDHRPSGS
jgi:Protein of unknown function (DUF2799)